ncbi:uncharacterized protein KQ657_002165 [Scheffersomyces spartinae]|uniref:Transmembrane protein 135 N-terminal domain-containing protein n=1 Tax=Scheffersomyces spartinae TaxID=45513 RepID=A0A9P8AJT9_9ASCO|nr:uncharacterized protein KQ657_002165 [Scheffersomyces spartinae]KAG7195780.1 hypothetical protein KQ657_002165 [Scheffersomyces spartinae]
MNAKIRGLLAFAKTRVGRPAFKAFLIAYLYVTVPRVLGLVLKGMKRKKYKEMAERVLQALIKACDPRKFPMFSAYLIAGINALEIPMYRMVKSYLPLKRPIRRLFLATFLASFITSMVAFPSYQLHVTEKSRYYSLDLTLLVLSRALDTVLSSYFNKILPASIRSFGDPALFIGSCSLIMFAWFYNPDALPPAYSSWITSAANMDPEMKIALRYLREGKLKYGEDLPAGAFLKEYAIKYGRDPKLGDFLQTQPLDCEMVHSFKTKSCELNALWRFVRGFEFAFKIYGPIKFIGLFFPSKNKLKFRLIRALISAIRSSCFLGSFIGLFWYAVCLVRTRLGPKLFPRIPRTRYDTTLCTLGGCVACGFSSFVETKSRRKELALFVAPRALGTIVPTENSKFYLQIEAIVFAMSFSVLVAYSKFAPKKIRGIFGLGFKQIFNADYYK